jgi:hypothetical protein
LEEGCDVGMGYAVEETTTMSGERDRWRRIAVVEGRRVGRKTLRPCFFRRKMVFVVKYFQENHFPRKCFPAKTFYSV